MAANGALLAASLVSYSYLRSGAINSENTSGLLVSCDKGGAIHLASNESVEGKACMICLDIMPESDRWAVKHRGVEDAHFGVHQHCGEMLGGRCPACREPASGLLDMRGSRTRVYVTSNDAA